MSFLATTRRGLLKSIGSLATFRPAPELGPDTFRLVPVLADGQSVRYRLIQSQHRQGMRTTEARSDATLTVVRHEGGGRCLRWLAGPCGVSHADPTMQALLRSLQSVWDGVPLDVHLDDGGHLGGLANLATVRRQACESLDLAVRRMAGDATSAPLVPHVQAAVRSLVLDESLLTQALLKEVRLLFGFADRAFRVGEPLEVRERVASPLGAGTVPVLGRFHLRSVDARTGEASLNWLMVVDRGGLAAGVKAGLEPMTASLAALVPPAPDVPDASPPVDAKASVRDAVDTVDLDDRAEFRINTRTGWPVSVHHVRRVGAGAEARVDTLEMVRLE